MGDFAGGLLLARELISPGNTVLCAVSGGADSVCLLHQLYRLRREVPFTLAAAHYNHRLRGEEAARDAAFVHQFVSLCCGRDRLLQPDGTWRELPPVELFIGEGDVAGEARRRRRGVEETARTINETKQNGGRVICVGTTSCRTVESFAAEDGTLKESAGWTSIFIYPGYRFKVLDALITNFHLPQSTLIMLVSALAGREHVLAAYEEAVKERYRFFSFGDAMFIGDQIPNLSEG